MNNHGLVNIGKIPGIIIDMRYATTNNTFKTILYDKAEAWLLESSAKKLEKAAKIATSRGYKLVVFDAYRPYAAQKKMWDIRPEPGFVARPEKGSIHNRGAAIDLSLADSFGKLIPMPSDFDEFSEKAAHRYNACSDEEKANRSELCSIMEAVGFESYSEEWWHYVDPENRNSPLIGTAISDLS